MNYNDAINDDYEVIPKTAMQIFDESFISYFELLQLRVNKLGSFEKGSLDFKTYFDMCLIQLRALCIESFKNTYTIQNFLRLHNREEKIKEVENFLDSNLGSDITLSKVIKVTTDKFIAHNEEITIGNADDYNYEYKIQETFYRFICEKDLSRKESGINIYKICEFFNSIVESVNLPEIVKNNGVAWEKWF